MKGLIFFVAFLTATPVFAQVDLGPSLYLSIAPQYPKAGEQVTLTVQNPINDISERTITWQSGGTTVLEGEGETVYRMTAPAVGERTDISVRVSGEGSPATVTIAPASVDLLWEADSYAPGLYRGRRLPSLSSTITLQAIPHLFQKGTELPAAQLSYTWMRNGQTMQSGKGKTTLSVPVAQFVESSRISVSVTTTDKSTGAERTAIIQTVEPTLRLYFEHPLYGTMHHSALSSLSDISDTEMSFAAIPYFAQAREPNDKQFSYIWRVNGTNVDANDERPNTLTINAGPAGGQAAVELSLTHKKLYQLDARGSWTVTFGSMTAPDSDLFSGQ
jgi:hypothetical protein